MVEVGTGGFKSRYLKTEWPIEEGLEAGTTTQEGREMNLKPEEGTAILEEKRKGIY